MAQVMMKLSKIWWQQQMWNTKSIVSNIFNIYVAQHSGKLDTTDILEDIRTWIHKKLSQGKPEYHRIV